MDSTDSGEKKPLLSKLWNGMNLAVQGRREAEAREAEAKCVAM